MADICILGASVSGAFATYLLGKMGFSVTPVEPAEREGSKACGEGLSLIGKKYLESAGLWRDEIAASALPYNGYELRLDERPALRLESPSPMGFSIRRAVIDSALLRAASALPSVWLVRDRATRVTPCPGGARVQMKSGLEFFSPHVVIASGRAGRRLLSAESKEPARFGLTLRLTGRWTVEPRSAVMIRAREGCQYVLTPLNGDTANLSLLAAGKSADTSVPPKEALVEEGLRFSRECGFYDSAAEPVKGASALQSSRARGAHPGIYLVGDAAEVFDPIGGMGMSHALVSASLAAEAIAGELASGAEGGRTWRRYGRRRSACATIFRVKTALTYMTVVKHRKLLRGFLATCPRTSARLLSGLEHFMPVLGAARSPGLRSGG